MMTLSVRSLVLFSATLTTATTHSTTHAFQLQPGLPAIAQRSPSCCIHSTTTTTTTTTPKPLTILSEHTLNQDSYDDNASFMEEDGPKAQLLEAIGVANNYYSDVTIKFGFGDDESSKSTVNKLVDDLSGYVLPLEKPSQWRLVYSGAPDLLGFQGGPLSQLVSIRNKVLVDGQQMEIVLEYQPSQNIAQLMGSFLSDIQDDRLTQTVLLDYTVGAMNKVDVQIRGTRIEGSRFGNNLPALESPAALPFGGFSIVFNDGDLRVDRSVQGDFLFIYKRV